MSEEGDRSEFDRLLDAGVFAPLGLALEYRRLAPELAEAGRKQVRFARSLGRAALQTVIRSAAARQTADVNGAKRPAGSAKAAAPTEPAEPAIASKYADLTARELIAQLRTADAATLDWVEKAEQGGRQRVTVLRAVDGRRAALSDG